MQSNIIKTCLILICVAYHILEEVLNPDPEVSGSFQDD